MITITVNPDGSGQLSGEGGEQRVNAGSVSQARGELLRLVASIAANKGSSVTVAAIDENGMQYISVDAFGAVALLDEDSVVQERDEPFSLDLTVGGCGEPPALQPEEGASTSESSLVSEIGGAVDPVAYSRQSPFAAEPEGYSPFDSQISNVDELEAGPDFLHNSGAYGADTQPPRIYPKQTHSAQSASSPYRVASPQSTSPDGDERLGEGLNRLFHASIPSESTPEPTSPSIIDYSSLIGVDGIKNDDSEIDPVTVASDREDDTGNVEEVLPGSAFRMDLSVFGSPGMEEQTADASDVQSSFPDTPDTSVTRDDVDEPSHSFSGLHAELSGADVGSAEPEGVSSFSADSLIPETPVTVPEVRGDEFNSSAMSTRLDEQYSPAPTGDYEPGGVGGPSMVSPTYGADHSDVMVGSPFVPSHGAGDSPEYGSTVPGNANAMSGEHGLQSFSSMPPQVPDVQPTQVGYADGSSVGGEASSFLAPNSTDGPRLSGWRGVARKFGLKVSASAADRRRWQDEQLISQRWLGTRTVAVLNGKGGACKTPTAILLASCFARYGAGGVVVADGNVTRGTLGWRTEQGPHQSTVLDLVPSIDRLLAPSAHYGDVSAFTHHQSIDHFDVLRSNPLLLSTQQKLTPQELDGVQEVLKKYYRLIVWDTGNDEGDDLWLRIVGHADQIVIATTTRSDHAEAGRLLLDGLAARSQRGAELSRNAVVVVSQADKSEAKPDSLVEGFSARAREVVTIPYDTGMREQWLRSTELASNTREAWVHAAAAVARGL